MSLRKIIKTRGSFPSEEAALKLLFLALRNVVDRWEIVQHWKAALSRFAFAHLRLACEVDCARGGARRGRGPRPLHTQYELTVADLSLTGVDGRRAQDAPLPAPPAAGVQVIVVSADATRLGRARA